MKRRKYTEAGPGLPQKKLNRITRTHTQKSKKNIALLLISADKLVRKLKGKTKFLHLNSKIELLTI